MNRRKFIATLSGGTITAATAAAAGFALTRTPASALAPWHQAGSAYTEPRKRALSYAILAPNPHNRQPWLADISRPDTIVLYVDTNRLLPHTDPFHRQITIGLGCFLELLRLAATQDGFRALVTPFPDGASDNALDQRPVAAISFARDSAVTPDPLFAHVLERRSLKEPFALDRPVESKLLELLVAAAKHGTTTGTTNASEKVSWLRDATQRAMTIEIETPRTYKESVDLFRIGKAEIEANPDGISFSGVKFEALSALGMFSRQTALDRSSSAYQQGIEAVMAPLATAMAYVWLETATNSREAQLAAGRDWGRINLAAAGAGVGLHPLSQALQEYPEMAKSYQSVHEFLAPGGGTVQMLGRLGYAASVPPSPRWPLEARIIKDKPLG